MSESTTRADAEEAAAAADSVEPPPLPPPPLPPPPPVYSTNSQPYATYTINPTGPSVVMYSQGCTYRQKDPDIENIRDYLSWSIFNICLGGLVLGLVAVALSSKTRSRKRSGDAASARHWSTMTLIYNICATLIGIALIILIIVYYAISQP